MSETRKPGSSQNGAWNYNRVMKWVRRIHMYLGLLMVPWVLLYGITGFLFNHPMVFSDHTTREVDSDAFEGTYLGALPEPQEVADLVVEALHQDEALADRSIQLATPLKARYDPGAWLDTAEGDFRYTLDFDVENRTGLLHERAKDGRFNPFNKVRRLEYADSTRAHLREAAIETFRRLGVEATWANPRWGPRVWFDLEIDGEPWAASLNLGNRQLEARPVDGWPGLQSVRQYLLRLHTAHTFPFGWGSRTVWAVLVDLMAAFMVLWAVTGILMWWQMKVVRVWGGIALATSLIIALVVGYAMYNAFRF